jgi:glycosyltransferase involved in cell wall biosynthesis
MEDTCPPVFPRKQLLRIMSELVHVNIPKVLVISNGYLPSIGGSYRVLHELLIRSTGVDIEVLTRNCDDAADHDRSLGYKIKRTIMLSLMSEKEYYFKNRYFKKAVNIRFIEKFLKYIIFPFISCIYLSLYIYKGRYTHVIFAQSIIPFTWFILLYKLTTNKKIIAFVVGEEITTYRRRNKSIVLLKKQFLFCLPYADSIIVNSTITKKELLTEGIDENKIQIVFPAVDYNYFNPRDKDRAKQSMGLPHDRYILLSVGRLIRRKGHDALLKVLPQLMAFIPNLLYLIRGEGPDKQYLGNIVSELHLEKYVVFINDLPYEKLPELHSAADIFILTNRLDEVDHEQEGFGIVFLEANACGIPVIGGHSGGVPDVITDGINGFLVDPLNPVSILDAIRRIHSEPSLFVPGELRKFIMSKYSWEHSSADFLKILRT